MRRTLHSEKGGVLFFSYYSVKYVERKFDAGRSMETNDSLYRFRSTQDTIFLIDKRKIKEQVGLFS